MHSDKQSEEEGDSTEYHIDKEEMKVNTSSTTFLPEIKHTAHKVTEIVEIDTKDAE